MKRKTTWIIALIAIPLVAAVFILHAQTKDNGPEPAGQRETASWFGVEKDSIM